MKASEATDLDDRAGSAWLRALDDATRLQLMAALLSRFNHDLRTPINTVSGWMHLLQHASDAPRISHVSGVIARNVTEQTTLLEEFMDDGRLLIGTLRPVCVPTTLNDVLSSGLDRAAAVASLHAVDLQTGQPEPNRPIKVDGPQWQRLIYRVVAAVIRRSCEAAVIEVVSAADRSGLSIQVRSNNFQPDWSEAALLDLRLATLHAALHEGRLRLASSGAEISLWLPID